jgi:predicted phage terminase large subunit-like protein
VKLASNDEYQFLLRHDFMSFIERGFYELNPQTNFAPSPYIELIASKLEACRRGKIKRLIVNLPPRSLKSHCTSVAFPAWCLGHDPSVQIITVSYGQDLADKFARDCRTVIQSNWYQGLFRTRLAQRQAVADFTTTEHGTRMATSVGGVLTGRGADIIIIDDPLKPDDALSATKRVSANEWYDNTLLSRLNSKCDGCIIIIMQRLHQDDLVGHVLEQDHWEVVSLAAVAEKDEEFLIETPFGRRAFVRKPGEALHPTREPLEILWMMRQSIGEYNFQSQYQQNPMPEGGAMVKRDWLRFYEFGEQPSEFSRIVQSWDSANKAGELNDFSVCTTWGVADRCYYLLDVFRQKLTFPDLKRAVLDQARRFDANTVVIEDKASGTQLIQELNCEIGMSLKAYKPPAGTDKVMRLHAQTTAFENGFVFLPRTAPWLNDYVNELISFPGTKYDDQVDSTTQALDYLRNIDSTLESWIRFGKASLPTPTPQASVFAFCPPFWMGPRFQF